MFKVDQKINKAPDKNEYAKTNKFAPGINPAEMLGEQKNAMQRNSGLFQNSFEPLQMKVEEEGEEISMKGFPTQMQEEEEEILAKKGYQKPVNSTNKSINSFANLNMALQTKMQDSFGTSFQDVNIHRNDGSAYQMGALAYTRGNDVHFAPGQFNPNTQGGQELLGHELTHVVQQRQGRVQPTKQGKGLSVNDNPTLEHEADAMGKRAASHLSNRGNSNTGGNYSPQPITQFYAPIDVASQSTNEWDEGEDLRVADNGMAATSENTSSKICYAHQSLIDQSNRELSARDSGVELVAESTTIKGSAPNGSGRRTLKKVMPAMSFSTSGTGASQTSWTDCGRMSREVMGEAGTDQNPHGVYTDSSGELQETARSRSPQRHRNNILVSLGLGTTPTAALAAYQAMTPADREAFDEEHGLNRFAAPSVGEAFSTHEADGFNFHWGGVVFRPGGDFVTLENFYKAGCTYDTQDTNWYFQMYGPATNPGQTWDEQWNAPGYDTFTSRTSTRSLEGATNAPGVRLVDAPANWDDSSHYVLLRNGTRIRKISTNDTRWIKVEVLDGTYTGREGYIMNHFFEGD
jgi:hypothetical protein